ncbi:MAG TPA: integrase arm-type DNA-binding domain-containing protein [Steroidobacteraceae bacterium]|jgi:hypothetical protein|nr:integrase arm-type DNA-binding domain-containing protein [Steroidobacteraceae bacterium]
MPTLTETRIRAAKPAEKPYKVFDERGLFILVTPSGGRLWRLRDDVRKLLADGIDPSAKRRAEKEQQVNTFEAVLASGWYFRKRAWTKVR